MDEQYSTKVRVKFADGSFKEFYASGSFDTSSQGRIVYWNFVSVDSKTIDCYAIPTDKIQEIQEWEI